MYQTEVIRLANGNWGLRVVGSDKILGEFPAEGYALIFKEAVDDLAKPASYSENSAADAA